MKKTIILLSLTAIAAVITGTSALKARSSKVVYTHGPTDPEGICCVTVIGRTFVTDPSGPDLATIHRCDPCVKGYIFTDIN